MPFVITGLVVGSIYAIAAFGLVLTYRTSGLFNFAHGALAMVAGYVFFQLREEWGVPSILAVPITLFVVAPLIGVLIDRVLFRSLANTSQASRVVATIGLLVLLRGGVEIVFGADPKRVEPYLPQDTISLGATNVGYDQLAVVGLALVAFIGLHVFFRRSRTGVAMRAVVDDPALVAGAGLSPKRLSAITWALGASLAGMAGVLLAPLVGLDTTTLTLLVVQAFAAAVIGRLTDLTRTYVAALALGVAGSVALKLFEDVPDLVNGLRPSLPFIFLFAYLVVAKRGSLRELGTSVPWQGTVRVRDLPWPPVAVGGVILALTLPDSRLLVLGQAIVLAIAYLSITVLTGTSGLISFAQAGFAGTGAFVTIHLLDAGLPFPLAVLLGALSVVPFGVVLAVPALRLSNLFVALLTFGFGLLIDGLIFTSWLSFSGGQDGIRATRPSLLRGDRAVTLFVLAVLVLVLIGVHALRRSALGRTLIAMRDSPSAATSTGIDPLWPAVAVFALSAFVAALSGGAYAILLGAASRTYFQTFTSVAWLVAVVVGGVQSAGGALLAAALSVYVPDLLAGNVEALRYVNPAFGLGAIVLASRPGGIDGLLRSLRPGRLVAIRPRVTPTPTPTASHAAEVAGG
ncbi:MAG: ABC transporter permease [Actinomycetota bacterium]|nr:ABC transporter permease [Actinomycetota bacterium]